MGIFEIPFKKEFAGIMIGECRQKFHTQINSGRVTTLVPGNHQEGLRLKTIVGTDVGFRVVRYLYIIMAQILSILDKDCSEIGWAKEATGFDEGTRLGSN